MENPFKKLLENLFSSANTESLTKTNFIFMRESGYGTKQSNGFLYEEYSQRFMDRQERFQTFLRMDNDGQVFQMRNAIGLIKVATNFFVDPFTEDGKEASPKDIEISKFVEKALFSNLDKGFKGFLEDINLYIRDGFSLFELYFEKKSDGFFYPQLTRISADTVFKWRTSQDEPGIQQLMFYPKGKDETTDQNDNEGECTIDLPANKLVLFNINAEGANYEGRSLYRKIAKDRFFKDKFENYHAVLQERMAVPPIKVKIPQGASTADQEKYKAIAENMRSFENGYVTEMIDENGVAIVGYEWMETKMGDNANKLTEAIKHYQQNINDIFFEQFLYLGKSEKGSYGMAGASTSFFFEAVKSLLEKDMEIINKYIIPKIVALNFGVVDRYPKIKFGQVGFTDPTSLTSTLTGLTGAGLLTANYETERHVRELLHLPAISEEEYEESKAQAQAPDMTGAVESDEGETADLENMEDVEIDDSELGDLESELDNMGENADFSEIGENIVQIFSDFVDQYQFKAPMTEETRKKISEALKKKGGTAEVEEVQSRSKQMLQDVNDEVNESRDAFNAKVGELKDGITELKDTMKKGNKAQVKAKMKELRAKVKEARAKQKEFMQKKKEQKKALRLVKEEATKEIRARKKEESAKNKEKKQAESERKKQDRASASAQRKAQSEATKAQKEATKKHSECECGSCNFSDEFKFDHNSIIDHQVYGTPEQDFIGMRNFADPIQEGFRRPLTFAERRVSIKSIKDNLTEEQKELMKNYSEISDNMTEKMLKQVQTAVEKNDYDALMELSAKYKTDISALVTAVYKKMFDYGKNEASREIGVQIPQTKKDLQDVIKIQSDNIAEGITSKVTTETKTIIAGAIAKADGLKNTSSANVIVSVKKAIKPILDQAFGVVATVSIPQAFNSGRKSVAYVNASRIYGAQYSAIIDGKTSDRCLSLDGKVVKVDSPEYRNYSPPQHIHCRSMWVFINDDEEYKPEYTEIPSSIPVKDTITSKEELKVPVISKDSPAIKQIQGEIDRRRAKNESLTGKRKEKNDEIINRLKKSIE